MRSFHSEKRNEEGNLLSTFRFFMAELFSAETEPTEDHSHTDWGLQIVHILHRRFPGILRTSGIAAIGICLDFLSHLLPSCPIVPRAQLFIIGFSSQMWYDKNGGEKNV